MHRAEAIGYREIIEDLREKKIPYLDEARVYSKTPWPLRVDKQAFPHQTEGVEAWCKAGERGVVVLPTGTGKTHLANLAINKAERPSLVVTPTIDLLNQWFDELTLAFGVEVGLLGGGYYDIKPLTVTTYDSAYQNVERLGNRVRPARLRRMPPPARARPSAPRRLGAIAPFRLGLTATPERADNAHERLDHLIGPIVYRREITQLNGQFLAEYRVESLFVNLTDEERYRYESMREIYRAFLSSTGIDMRRRAPGGSSSSRPTARPRVGKPTSPIASSARSPWPRRPS